MSMLLEEEIEYPYTVTVARPGGAFDESGNYVETYSTIIESMTADIQLSLKIRRLISEDSSGVSDNTVWLMFCNPPERIQESDRVSDGERMFVIDSVADWASHVECVMRKL